MTTAIAVLPPELSPLELCFCAFCNCVGSVLVGDTEPPVVEPVVVGLAALVGVRMEVTKTTWGVSPGRVADGVMTIMDVWISVAVGAADGAVSVCVVSGA